MVGVEVTWAKKNKDSTGVVISSGNEVITSKGVEVINTQRGSEIIFERPKMVGSTEAL